MIAIFHVLNEKIALKTLTHQRTNDANDNIPSTSMSLYYEQGSHHHYHPNRQINTSLERKIRYGRFVTFIVPKLNTILIKYFYSQ